MRLADTEPSPPASPPRLYALVPCAGVGARAGTTGPKQYEALAGGTVVGHTLAALSQVARVHQVLVVLSPGDRTFETLLPRFDGWVAPCGGATRADTVAAGLGELLARGAVPEDWVLVHDAARCLVRAEWINALIDACLDDATGGLLALPVADTMKRAATDADGSSRVCDTVDRAGLWQAQTPQMFRIGPLRQALAHAGADVTDEASAIEAGGGRPRLVRGHLENLKLTYPSDFALAERLLRSRESPSESPR